MYTTVKGYYENGHITITEPAPPAIQKSEVIVTFLEVAQPPKEARRPGFLKEYAEALGISLPPLPDDFNAPLDDLKDYM